MAIDSVASSVVASGAVCNLPLVYDGTPIIGSFRSLSQIRSYAVHPAPTAKCRGSALTRTQFQSVKIRWHFTVTIVGGTAELRPKISHRAKSKDFVLEKACQKLQRAIQPNRLSARGDGAMWAQRGAAAIAAGDLPAARKAFVSAVKRDSGNASYRYHLALLLQASGQRAEAAEQLTMALRLDPKLQKAAWRLGEILAHGILADKHRLDEAGLTAAIAFDTVERDLFCAAGLHQLANSHLLRNMLEYGRREGWDNVARKLCVDKTHDLLKQPFFTRFWNSVLFAGSMSNAC